jgi:hypothetical protein
MVCAALPCYVIRKNKDMNTISILTLTGKTADTHSYTQCDKHKVCTHTHRVFYHTILIATHKNQIDGTQFCDDGYKRVTIGLQ